MQIEIGAPYEPQILSATALAPKLWGLLTENGQHSRHKSISGFIDYLKYEHTLSTSSHIEMAKYPQIGHKKGKVFTRMIIRKALQTFSEKFR